MNHYMDFDPYYTGVHNEALLREVRIHRLERSPRQEQRPLTSRLADFVSGHALPLLRGTESARPQPGATTRS